MFSFYLFFPLGDNPICPPKHKNKGKSESEAHFRVDSKLNGWYGQHGVHMNLHPVNRRDDGPLQPLGPLRALSVFQGALIADGSWSVLLALSRPLL